MNVNYKDIEHTYNIVSNNIKNKKLVYDFEKRKMACFLKIIYILEKNLYSSKMFKFNISIIKDPKLRVIMSESLFNKVINHYAALYILNPKLSHLLSKEKCATRKNMGTYYAISKLKKDIEYYKKYDNFYFLKLDIKKYFYNIDHQVLKKLIKKYLNDDEYNLVCSIIDATDELYVNEKIKYYEDKLNIELTKYETGKGLPIGSMTSQFLAIFYLHKVHHYIKHNLKIKHFTIYMDDYIILHEDKEYLSYVLKEIKRIFKNEYHLDLNEKKTYIVRANNGVVFLGYKFIVKNKKTIILLSKESKNKMKRGIKKRKYQFETEKISFESYFSSYMNYKDGKKFINSYKLKEIIEKYI